MIFLSSYYNDYDAGRRVLTIVEAFEASVGIGFAT